MVCHGPFVAPGELDATILSLDCVLSVNTGEYCCGFSVLRAVGVPSFPLTQVYNHMGLAAVLIYPTGSFCKIQWDACVCVCVCARARMCVWLSHSVMHDSLWPPRL